MQSALRLLTAIVFLLGSALGQSQAAPKEPDHDLMHRGNQGMGFAQDKTTHHFFLLADGGVIQVTAKDADDKASIEQIRMHLRHVSRAFQSGDFNIPGFVHDQTPPGVPVMTKLKDKIHYTYEGVKQGGRVVISSNNADAVKAVHNFLRFQITEHKTGDRLEVQAASENAERERGFVPPQYR